MKKVVNIVLLSGYTIAIQAQISNKPNVVIVLADEWRAQTTGYNGDQNVRTPNLDKLAKKVKAGGSGVWGAIPMPAQNITEADAKIIANWLANGAPK